ncbi:ABC transporter ATP-binding protein [Isoalcanivorax beigongshangi]|uniref:ABC transporter ATP-binding protein n=1 Tax=Isoalcanivorax beigongshangi TaxID=3238810 RepID=A0ABV4AMB8_9GAMM
MILRWLARLIEGGDPAALAWLYSFVKPHRRAIAGLLVLSLAASALVLVQPWLMKLLIDDGVLAGSTATLAAVALAMVGLGLVGTLLSGLNRYLHTRLSGRVLFSLREAVYGHLQRLSPRFYGRHRIGDLMTRLDGDVAEIQRFAIDALFSAVSSLLGLIGALTLLVLLSWQLSLLVLVLVPIELVWLRWMRRRVEREARALRERSSDMSSFLVETLPAMKHVQGAGREAHEADRLHGLGNGYMQQLLRLQLTEFATHAVPGTLTSFTRAGAFLIGGYWVIQGHWQLGSLMAFSTYLGMVIGPAQSLLGLYVAIQRMTVSLGRVRELALAEPEVTLPPQPQPLPPPGGRLVLEAVSFQHPDRPQILDRVSLALEPGSKTLLTGPSGTGKSTLIDLLLRFYDPDHGRICYDGVDLRELDLSAWRRRVALVSQDIVLFRGSLRDNLRYAAPEASDAALAAAVAAARLDDLLASLPQGLDSPLAERGQQLSGGQRQRIAIARALLQAPDILLLDEATSAVDRDTEAAIMADIDRLFGHCTRLVISHRSVAGMTPDQQWHLVDGRIAEGVRDDAVLGAD